MRRRTILLVATAIMLVAIPAGGVAYARWSAGGTGTGSGATGTTSSLTLSPGTPSSILFPGGTTSVLLTVSNPNQSPIRISTLALDSTQGTSGYSVDSGHAACATSALTYSTQTNGGSGWTVPAKVGAVNGSLVITLSSALAMATTASNACQGASFTIYLAAS